MRTAQLLATTLLCQGLAEAAHGNHFLKRGFNEDSDLHLGTLRSLDDFYERLGTNSSDWEVMDFKAPEPSTELAARDRVGVSRSARTGTQALAPRQDTCSAPNSLWEVICEALPTREWIWAAGVLVFIRYLPRNLNAWLDDVSVLYENGLNLARRFRRIQGGAEGPVIGPGGRLAIRDVNMNGLSLEHMGLVARDDGDFEPEYIHFNIENELPTVAKRALEDNDGLEMDARSYTRYVLHPRSGELKSVGNDATMTSRGADKRRSALQKRGEEETELVSNIHRDFVSSDMAKRAEEWDEYSIIITGDSVGGYKSDSSTGCIRDWLKERIHLASVKARHTCMHLVEPGHPDDYFAHSGVFINKGADNWDQEFGDCC